MGLFKESIEAAQMAVDTAAGKAPRRIRITWGQDTPAYVDQDIVVPHDTTDEEVIAQAKAKADDVGDLVFDPSYDWTGLRIVAITEHHDDQSHCLAEGIPIESSGEDLGVIARSVLMGTMPMVALLQEAERQGITVDPEVRAALEVVKAPRSQSAGLHAVHLGH